MSAQSWLKCSSCGSKLECAACGKRVKSTSHLSTDGRQLCPRCWGDVSVKEVREMIRKRDAVQPAKGGK